MWGYLANAMELQEDQGAFELLQGETIALLAERHRQCPVQAAIAQFTTSRQPQAASSLLPPLLLLISSLAGNMSAKVHSSSKRAGSGSCRPGRLVRSMMRYLQRSCSVSELLVVLMHLLGDHLGSHAYQVRHPVPRCLPCKAAAAA